MPIKEMINQVIERIGAVARNFDYRADLLDILFVSLMIYGLIRLIRQTRGAQLLKGLLFLVVAYGAVKLLNMRASLFIFDQAFSQLLILMVVLFQPP